MKKIISILAVALLQSNLAWSTNLSSEKMSDQVIDIWPTVPFIRGADLCKYKDAYSQTRSGYMNKMVHLARELMDSGAKAKDVLPLLTSFNQMYDLNTSLATQHQYLDVTLESTLKSYLSEYYRNLRPRKQKVSFTSAHGIVSTVKAAAQGQRDGLINAQDLEHLDYFSYGTYAFAPNCAGDIQVTLHLIGRSGQQKSYLAQGQLSTVMSQIATKIFEDFQRTRLPTQIKLGSKFLTILGGMNGSVDQTFSTENAVRSCETLGARLPTPQELEMIDAYGDWSGGISLGKATWALADGHVYIPWLQNQVPVRKPSEINPTPLSYYCVQD